MSYLINKQILNLLEESEDTPPQEKKPDPQDSISGFGNYHTDKGTPPLKSKKVVDAALSEINKVKSVDELAIISVKYKDITYGESQAVLHSVVVNSNLLYNTVAAIRHAPENAVPSKPVIDKITGALGPQAIEDWICLKHLFIENPQNQMQLTCLILAGLVILYDN